MYKSVALAFVLAMAVTQLAIFVTTVYLHRGLAHRAVRLSPAVNAVCRLLTWTTTGIRPRQWVAVHRKHHAHTDVEGDPHSPRLLGFMKVQFGNVVLYKRAAKNKVTVAKYARDLRARPLGPVPVRPRPPRPRHRHRPAVRRPRAPARPDRSRGPRRRLPAAERGGERGRPHLRPHAQSRTPPPTRSGWPGSPPVRACTTTTTPPPRRPACRWAPARSTRAGG